MSRVQKGKGNSLYATIYSNTLSISQKTGFKYNSFEVMVLHITLSRESSINVDVLMYIPCDVRTGYCIEATRAPYRLY